MLLVGSKSHSSRLPGVLEEVSEDEKNQFPQIGITVHQQSIHKKTTTYAEAFAFWFS